MTNQKPLAFAFLALAAACASAPKYQLPTAPTPPAPYEVELADLQGSYDNIGNARNWPAPPTPRRLSAEEVVNRKAVFLGTGEPLLKAGTRVAVIAAHEVVGKDSPAKYISDAVQQVLQEHQLELVDREYVDFLEQENARLHKKTIDTSDADRANRMDAQNPCDYYVFVHLIGDNSGSSKGEYIELPYRISDVEWELYQQQCDQVQAAMDTHAASIDGFNRKLFARISEAAFAITQREGAWETYAQQYAAYQQKWQEYRNAVPKGENFSPMQPAAKQRYVLRRPQAKPMPTPAAKSKLQVLEEELAVALASAGFQPLEPGKQMGRRIVFREELLKPDLPVVRDYVSVHKFSISLRIVDTKTLKTVWFGQAEAQNLRHLDAVRECTTALADQLIVKPEPAPAVESSAKKKDAKKK